MAFSSWHADIRYRRFWRTYLHIPVGADGSRPDWQIHETANGRRPSTCRDGRAVFVDPVLRDLGICHDRYGHDTWHNAEHGRFLHSCDRSPRRRDCLGTPVLCRVGYRIAGKRARRVCFDADANRALATDRTPLVSAGGASMAVRDSTAFGADAAVVCRRRAENTGFSALFHHRRTL